MVELYSLSKIRNGFDFDVDSLVIEKYCEEYDLNFISSLNVVKKIINSV